MPTPEGLDVTTLHGLYVEPNQAGTPLQGTLSFTPNPTFITFPDEDTIVAGTETVTLDSNGEFTIDLVSTGQGTENPPDWLYTVSERITGQRPRTYNIALPYSSGVTLELSDITPTDAAPTYIPVVGPQGPPGIVTSVNGYSMASINLVAADVGALATSARGAANGVASLDASTKVPIAQLPDLSATYVPTSAVGAANGIASLGGTSLVPPSQLDLASAIPPSVGTGVVGASTKLARQDHTHDGVDLVNGQSIAGAKNFTTSTQTARLGVGVTPATHRGRVKSIADEVVLFLEQTVASPANSLLSIQSAASADKAYASSIPADTVSRLAITVAGALNWGPGNSATDVSLSRSAVGVLTTDGQIISTQSAPTAAGHLTRKDYVDTNFVGLTGAQTISGVKTFSSAPISQAASAGTVVLNARVTGDTVSRLTVGADGTLSWGPGGSTATDFALSRVSSVGLNLNGTYQSTRSATSGVGFSALVTADTFDRYRIYADGLNEWGPGNAARDTNLYRSAANVLKTDDSLVVLGNLTVSGVGQVLGAYKSADTARTSTSPTNDPHLTATLTANGVYRFEATLFVVTSDQTNGDIALNWTLPGTSTAEWGFVGQPITTTAGTGTMVTQATSGSAISYGAIQAADLVITCTGTIIVDGTGGTFALLWNLSGTSGTVTLRKYSSLLLTRLA